MSLLVLGLVIFFAVHLVPAMPSQRVVAAGVISYRLLAWLHPWLFGAAAFVRS